MPSWPTLPPPAINSFSEQSPDNTIRSSMDKGPDQVRRRTSANVRLISFSLKLTATQTETLDTFYQTSTAGGSLAFDYNHPRTGAAVQARFTQPPTYSDIEGQIYNAEVSLEILP
jgi:hypothetical protein